MKQLQLQLFAGRPGQTAATQPAAAPHAGTVLADELTRDPGDTLDRLGRLADTRRAMKLPPRT